MAAKRLGCVGTIAVLFAGAYAIQSVGKGWADLAYRMNFDDLPPQQRAFCDLIDSARKDYLAQQAKVESAKNGLVAADLRKSLTLIWQVRKLDLASDVRAWRLDEWVVDVTTVGETIFGKLSLRGDLNCRGTATFQALLDPTEEVKSMLLPLRVGEKAKISGSFIQDGLSFSEVSITEGGSMTAPDFPVTLTSALAD